MPSIPIAKFPMEEKTLLVAQPIAQGAVQSFSSIFPVGKGAGETWERIRLTFHAAMTAAGVWTFPVESGLINFIRNVRLETSDGETICDAPASALHILNWWMENRNPWHTPVPAAVTGVTFDAIVDIPLGFSFLRKPEDGYLDSGAYSGIRLTITTGTPVVAGAGNFDMGIGNAGANAMVCTMDMSIIRTKAGFYNNAQVKPLFVPYIKYIGGRTPSNVQTFFDIESANDLALFGFMLADGSVARQPFDHVVAATGLTAETDTITGVTFGDNIIPNIVDNKRLDSFRSERLKAFNVRYPLTAPVVPNIPSLSEVGKYVHNFVKDGSVYGAYPTGNKSQIRLSYTGGAAGTATVDALIWGFRTKRKLF